MGGVWWTITQIWLNDATAVIFSVKCFNPLKLSSIRKHLKRFASYFLFIHEHLIKYWFSTVNLIAVTTVLLTFSLHRCYQRIFKEKMNKCVSKTHISPYAQLWPTSASVELTQTRHSHSKQLFHGGQISQCFYREGQKATYAACKPLFLAVAEI